MNLKKYVHIGKPSFTHRWHIWIEVENQSIPLDYNPPTKGEAQWYQKQTINALEKIIKTESAMKE